MSGPAPEKIISRYGPVKLEGKGTGRLVVTDRRIIFEKKKGFLSNKIIPQVTIDTSSLLSIEQLEDFGVKVIQEGEKGSVSYKITPNNPTDAIEIVQTLSALVSERKLTKDRHELSEKDLKLRETKYLSYILDSGSKLWELSSLSLSILRGLGFEDWDRAENILEKLSKTTSSLTKENSFSFGKTLEMINSSVKSRSTERVGEAISAFIEAVGTGLTSAAPPASEWIDYSSPKNPDWGSLSYLFLFSVAINEGISFEENGLGREKEIASSNAAKLIPIMQIEFNQDLFKNREDDVSEGSFVAMASEFNLYLRDALQDSLRETSLLA